MASPTRSGARARGGAAGWLAVPDHRYAALKWGLLALLAAYILWVVAMNGARDVAFPAIEQRMVSVAGGLEREDENGFQERFGAAPEGCEGWLLYGTNDLMDVSEFLAVKARGEALERMQSLAEARLDAQKEAFRSYGTNQSQLLEQAALWQRGDYLFYAVGEQADVWEDAFLSAIR